jgi:predicted nucleic-acid-binding Zn-ribbon protein
MSNIAIAGDTSGTVTLQAPAVAGTTVLTLPSTSGTIATSANIRSGASYATLTTGTTNITLTSSSNQLQIVSADQEGCSITLPDATTMTLGSGYFEFYNASIYPIAIKDNGGTIREYLYPNTSNTSYNTVNPVPVGSNTSTLSLQENSNANGVWHIEKTTLSAYSSLASYVLTTISNTGTTFSGLIRVNSTSFIALSYTSVSAGSWYAKLFTYNPSTKTFTAQNSVTLATCAANYAPFYISGDSNGVDRGVIFIGMSYAGSQQSNINGRSLGFAVVSNTLYVSGLTTVINQSATSQAAWYGEVQYVGSNNAFFVFAYSSGYGSAATAFTVGLSGTTVTTSQCTGSLTYTANGNSYWIAAPTSLTTWVVDPLLSSVSGRYYISYNPSTNVMSGGSRTSQTTIIIPTYTNATYATQSGYGRSFFVVNSASTKIILTDTYWSRSVCWAVTNAGTATVTVTDSTYTIKPYAGKNYGSGTGINVSDVYIISASEYLVVDQITNTLYSLDPTNANFNINFSAYKVNGTNYLTSSTNILGISILSTSLSANQYTLATPFVS